MEVVTRYRSGGRDFVTEAGALNHDRLLRIVAAVNAFLGPAEGIDPNGSNYKQHDAAAVQAFDNAFCDALKSEFPKEPHAAYTRGYIGRILDDSNHPFVALYYRLARIDSQNREWGQIYYANHPNPEAVRL